MTIAEGRDKKADFPEMETNYKETINSPIFPEFENEQVNKIVAVLQRVIK